MTAKSALKELELQKVIENGIPYNDEAVEEWEEHFNGKATAELVEIKIRCERKYFESHYPTVILEQIIALRNILKERMKKC